MILVRFIIAWFSVVLLLVFGLLELGNYIMASLKIE